MLLLTGTKMKVILRKWIQTVIGCFLTAGGLIILQHSGIVTGGTAGLSLGLAPLLGLPFPLLFTLLNLPFFLFAYMYMGKTFTCKTILAILLLTAFTSVDVFLPNVALPAIPGAIAGGLLIGAGVSTLFRSGASLGGATLLALYLHKKYGINPGKSNFIFDVAVILTSLAAYSMVSGLLSILSIGVTSFILSLLKRRARHAATLSTPSTQTAPHPS
ncbi:YitT family protein [Paenibacillus sp. PL2-23]|uniref:YitT family protein n=1 Tax=Paenibacillus sp. PL2-23 TaxID=2100729 RepID=UPI0030F5C8DA